MNLIDRILVSMLDKYYKSRNLNKTKNPIQWICLCFGITLSTSYFSIVALYCHFGSNNNPSQIQEYITIFLTILSMGILSQYYLSNDRYLKLYQECKERDLFFSSRQTFFYLLLFIFGPFIFTESICLIF